MFKHLTTLALLTFSTSLFANATMPEKTDTSANHSKQSKEKSSQPTKSAKDSKKALQTVSQNQLTERIISQLTDWQPKKLNPFYHNLPFKLDAACQGAFFSFQFSEATLGQEMFTNPMVMMGVFCKNPNDAKQHAVSLQALGAANTLSSYHANFLQHIDQQVSNALHLTHYTQCSANDLTYHDQIVTHNRSFLTPNFLTLNSQIFSLKQLAPQLNSTQSNQPTQPYYFLNRSQGKVSQLNVQYYSQTPDPAFIAFVDQQLKLALDTKLPAHLDAFFIKAYSQAANVVPSAYCLAKLKNTTIEEGLRNQHKFSITSLSNTIDYEFKKTTNGARWESSSNISLESAASALRLSALQLGANQKVWRYAKFDTNQEMPILLDQKALFKFDNQLYQLFIEPKDNTYIVVIQKIEPHK